MVLTGKQAHVLANLDRVVKRPYKIKTSYRKARFDLDGWECTTQVDALVVKRQVLRLQDGDLARLS